MNKPKDPDLLDTDINATPNETTSTPETLDSIPTVEYAPDLFQHALALLRSKSPYFEFSQVIDAFTDALFGQILRKGIVGIDQSKLSPFVSQATLQVFTELETNTYSFDILFKNAPDILKNALELIKASDLPINPVISESAE